MSDALIDVPESSAARLIAASLDGQQAIVDELLARHPELTARSMHTAAALGDRAAIERWLGRDSSVARAKGAPRDWEPMLYLCFGRCGGDDAARAAAAPALLAAGADANASFIDHNWPNSALPMLYGATGVNNYPQLARVLLAAGANPNDCESRYHAAEHNHVACLELLQEFSTDFSGVDPIWTNTPLYFLFGWRHPAPATVDGIRWLIEHGADPNVRSYAKTVNETALHAAVNNGWDAAMIELLVQHGADPLAPRNDGRSPFDLAVRGARDDIVALFRRHGVTAEPSGTDRFLGACMRADESEARAILAREPNVLTSLSRDDRGVVFAAATDGRAAALNLMGALGFDLAMTGNDDGATPLHWASWHGRSAAVNALLAHQVPLDVHDTQHDAPPIGWCAHGSQFCRNPDADYPAVAVALVAAGAQVPKHLEGSPEIMAALRQLGALA